MSRCLKPSTHFFYWGILQAKSRMNTWSGIEKGGGGFFCASPRPLSVPDLFFLAEREKK